MPWQLQRDRGRAGNRFRLTFTQREKEEEEEKESEAAAVLATSPAGLAEGTEKKCVLYKLTPNYKNE